MFLRYFAHVYQIPQSYELQLLKYRLRQRDVFVILGHFLPFYCINNPKNWNFEKNEKKKKKILGDIITLHLGTTNYDHIMYGSWDMEHDRQNFFSCFDHFLPFYPKKIKILKWWKKYLEISSFRTVYQKLWSDHVWYLRYGAWQTDRQMDWLTYGKCDTKRWVPNLERTSLVSFGWILWNF